MSICSCVHLEVARVTLERRAGQTQLGQMQQRQRMAIFIDPKGQTFLYTMHVESLNVAAAGRADLIGKPLECQWHAWGCKHRSTNSFFVRSVAESTQVQYDAFFIVTFRNMQ